jgi:hypothetical protein
MKDIESDKQRVLNNEGLKKLTGQAVKELEAIVFCGFLIREDDETLYIADPQGTWVISRKETTFIEEWKTQNAPESLSSTGRPVRIGIREGAIIHEIRPWEIKTGIEVLGGGVQKEVEKIFTLGGAQPAIGERAILGESQLRDMERVLSRRLGYAYDDPSVKKRAGATSGTWVLEDGYCDTDCDF